MKATDELKNEHEGVMLMLQIIEKLNEAFEQEKDVDIKDLEGIMEFLKVFIGNCHHTKEEEILFPVIEHAGIPREGGPIGVMLIEHTMGRDYIRVMSEAVEAYSKGNKDIKKKFVENARAYIALLKQHIDKENNVFYMMGSSLKFPVN